MQHGVQRTKITLRSDYPTSVASEAFGANIGGVAFNLNYINERKPELVEKIIKLYEECRKLKETLC